MAINVSADTLDRDSRIFMNVPQPRSISPISPSRSEGHHQQDPRNSLLSSIGRRFGRKTSRESRLDYQDDSGCSTDSCSSAGANLGGSSSSNYSSILSNLTGSNDDTSSNTFEEENLSSCSTEERGKAFKNSKLSVHFRSTSSLRRALKSLSISTRSLSCTGSRTRSSSHADVDEEDSEEEHFEYEKRVSFKPVPHEMPSATSPTAKSGDKKSSSLISQRSKTPPPQRRILRQPVSYLYLKGISGLPTQRVPRSSVCCPQGYR